MLGIVFISLTTLALIIFAFLDKGFSKLHIQRRVFQVIFMLIVIAATINTYWLRQGKGLTWLQDSIFTYVCPIGGVISSFKYMTSQVTLAERLHNPASIIIGSIVIVTLVFGPVFCGWLCPFGALQEFLASVFKKINKKYYGKIIGERTDNVLKNLRYITLGGAVILVAASQIVLLESINPYRAFLNLFINVYSVTGLTVLGIVVILAFIVERPWCRYLCPYGMLLGIFNMVKLFAVRRNADTCVNCKRCDKVCPMSIKVSDKTVVRQHSCISCMECTSSGACPKKSTVDISLTRFNHFKMNRGMIGGISGFLITLLVATSILSTRSIRSKEITAKAVFSTKEEYTYVAEDAYEVIENTATSENNATASETTASEETTEQPNEESENPSNDSEVQVEQDEESNKDVAAIKEEKAAVTESTATQSEKVDQEISDKPKNQLATQPAEKAANQAANKPTEKIADKETPKVVADQPTEKPVEKPLDEPKEQPKEQLKEQPKMYKDGTYTAGASGYSPIMQVEVTLANDKITGIRILQHNETPGFYERVFNTIPAAIISSQSANVDVVSGASLTSNAIITAIKNALAQAKL